MYIVENNYTSLAHDRTEDEPTNRIKCHLKNLNQATCLPKRNNSHSKREEFGKHSGRQEWIEAEGRAGEVREEKSLANIAAVKSGSRLRGVRERSEKQFSSIKYHQSGSLLNLPLG